MEQSSQTAPARRQRRPWTEEDQQEAERLRALGWGYKKIGRAMERSGSHVQRCLDPIANAKDLEKCRLYRERNQERLRLYFCSYRVQNAEKILASRHNYRENNREAIRARGKIYYDFNREKRIATRRKWYAQNSEKIKQRQRLYYTKTQDKRIAYRRSYYYANRDKCIQARREWYSQNRDAALIRAKLYRRQNRERIRGRIREWRLANPERVAAWHRKRNALKRSARKRSLLPLSFSERCMRFEMFGGRCAYCGSCSPLTEDHVLALSEDGLHEAPNIAPACMSCNTSKGARPVEDWYRRQPFFTEVRWRKIQRHCPAAVVGQLPLALG